MTTIPGYWNQNLFSFPRYGKVQRTPFLPKQPSLLDTLTPSPGSPTPSLLDLGSGQGGISTGGSPTSPSGGSTPQSAGPAPAGGAQAAETKSPGISFSAPSYATAGGLLGNLTTGLTAIPGLGTLGTLAGTAIDREKGLASLARMGIDKPSISYPSAVLSNMSLGLLDKMGLTTSVDRAVSREAAKGVAERAAAGDMTAAGQEGEPAARSADADWGTVDYASEGITGMDQARDSEAQAEAERAKTEQALATLAAVAGGWGGFSGLSASDVAKAAGVEGDLSLPGFAEPGLAFAAMEAAHNEANARGGSTGGTPSGGFGVGPSQNADGSYGSPGLGGDPGGVDTGGMSGAGADPGADGGPSGPWRKGGYTGDDGDAELEPKLGVVHEREFVQRPEAVALYGVEFMEALNQGLIDPVAAQSLLEMPGQKPRGPGAVSLLGR